MTDAADTAADYADNHNAEALSRRVRYTGESATECRECADPIPEPRREAIPGVTLCVACQDEQERRR